MKNFFKSNLLRSSVILLLILVFTVVGINHTIAFLMRGSLLTNQFDVGSVDVRLTETFDGIEKKDVYATNDGDVDVYVRAAISINWQSGDGTILSQTPQSSDYSLTLNSESWTKGSDGFYYYKEPLPAGESTANLIESCIQVTPYSDRKLAVDVVIQSIQAAPSTAVEDAWNVTVNTNSSITPTAD